MRAFLAIADLWELSDQERLRVLGDPAPSACTRWTASARARGSLNLDIGTLTRISAVLGIYGALGILHPDPVDTVAWLRRSHPAPPFGGRSPLDLATAGGLDGLLAMRRFLDAVTCGGVGMAPSEIDADTWPDEPDQIVVDERAV